VTHIHPVGWEQAFARLRRLGYLCEKHGNRLHVRTGPNSFPRKLSILNGQVSEREITRLEADRG